MLNMVFGIVILNRFYDGSSDGTHLQKSVNFVSHTLTLDVEHIYSAINVAEDNANTDQIDFGPGVTTFGVQPSGEFTLELNALLDAGRQHWADGHYPLVLSNEVHLTDEDLKILQDQMGEDTLVAGAVLEGHLYEPGSKIESADGRQIPWNTCALWNPRLLWRTGFPKIGDGPIDSIKDSGVEEYSAIALQQFLYGPSNAKAKLVDLPSVSWETDHFEGQRLQDHIEKIEFKKSRPEAQRRAARLPTPTVIHV